MPHSKKDKVDTLRRRADYLAERIAKEGEKGRDLSYDKAEESALRWAIDHLSNCQEDIGNRWL